MLTKKHFKEIAYHINVELLKTQPNTSERKVLVDLADGLAGYFKQLNTRFDKHKFIEACGIERV